MKTGVLIPVIASFVLSSTAGLAQPVADTGELVGQTQQQPVRSSSNASGDQSVMTLKVVRSKDHPEEIRLVDMRQPAPAASAPEPPSNVTADAAPAQQGHEPAPAAQPKVIAESKVESIAPSVSETHPSPKPETKAESKPAVQQHPKPAVKPATAVKKPVAAPKKPTVAPKPKSPAPKAAVKKAQPAAKPKSPAPKPNPQKQGMLSKVVRGATGLASRALSWIGTRYIWGGMSSKGVDCSGLTSLIYRSIGIKLPHNARQQFKLGRPVAKSDLSPGDLVFFNTSGPISHVGIYIGNNKFVHAANKRRGVRTDSLGSSYYHKRYAGARRYI